MKAFEDMSASIKECVGDEPVLLLISGGVDSTVTAAVLLKSLKPEQVHLMYMDTGLMRKNETVFVRGALEKLGAKNIHIVMCESEFLSALKGITEPEEKRRVIGDMFITIQEREVSKLGLPETYFLAQGTLLIDLVESGAAGSGSGGGGGSGGSQASVIKSHHNVASPLVAAKRAAGKIVEPLAAFTKEQGRELGRFLGVDDEIIRRHPFPGPGIGVRILGEITKEKCDILRDADAIFIEELKRRNLYDAIWQAAAILLPIRSVGLTCDDPPQRRYGWVLALRAVIGDGATALPYPFEIKDILEISERITREVKDIGRVTYDISAKPPATIEWE